MNDMDDVINEFLIESHENLDELDRSLVWLEEKPDDLEKLASVFRAIHTIKGTCGFLELTKLERVAHSGENLLSLLRDGRLLLNAEITTALLAMLDAVREILGAIESDRSEGAGDYSALINTLERLQSGGDVPAAIVETADTSDSGNLSTTPEPNGEVSPAGTTEDAETEFPKLGEILIGTGEATPREVSEASKLQTDGDNRRLGEILVDQGSLQPQGVTDSLQVQAEAKSSSVADGSIRVDVGLLDKLMNLVGELVLARNQILQFSSNHEDSGFVGTSQRLNLITTELQEGVMKTRMQPIGNVWSKFPRVIRDLARSCGKQIRIEMEGKETDLDKTIIEAIKDPLTHIVRNSADHGIEEPEVRIAAGKPAEGCLKLRAFHEGGQVNIEISDDGAGIDPGRLKEKAIDKGIISREQGARMSDREAVTLVFAPGFSTAQTVTNVSGRGVGMSQAHS